MTTSTSSAGGWSAWNFTLSAAAQSVLDGVTKELLGVSYKGLAFASQLVNGTNYAFLCVATDSTETPVVHPVVMHVYAPLKGTAVVTSIVQLGPTVNNLPGGYSSWVFPPASGAKKVFDDGVAGLLGVTYKPIGDTSQVVAGANYCFLASATVVYPGALAYPVLVNTFQPLKGNAVVREIHNVTAAQFHTSGVATAAE